MAIGARIIGCLILIWWGLFSIIGLRNTMRNMGGEITPYTIFVFNHVPFMVGFGMFVTGQFRFLLFGITFIILTFIISLNLISSDPILNITFIFYSINILPLKVGWYIGYYIITSLLGITGNWAIIGGIIASIINYIFLHFVIYIITLPPFDFENKM